VLEITRFASWTPTTTPSRNDVPPMLAVKFAFHFCQPFVAEMRKASNGTDRAKEDGELRVHSFRLLTEQLKKL
jgi:hypothetical protein